MKLVFEKLKCLEEQTPKLDIINKKELIADKRYLDRTLTQFIQLNNKMFDFLEIEPISQYYPSVMLSFKTSKYIGAIPLISPVMQQQVGDLLVVPDYTSGDGINSIISIANMFNLELEVDYFHSQKLRGGIDFTNLKLYNALQFISTFADILKKNWLEFSSEIRWVQEPKNVLWDKYLLREYDAHSKIVYPSKKSSLIKYHSEFCKLFFVYNLCIRMYESNKSFVPLQLKVLKFRDYIARYVKHLEPIKTNNIAIHKNDSHDIQRIKILANKILLDEYDKNFPWRVDIAKLFELYAQNICRIAAQSLGGQYIPNVKIMSSKKHTFRFALNYLEPDGIIYYLGKKIITEIKYKSYWYNKHRETKYLREEFRKDLQQTLAYSTFETSSKKKVFLILPSGIASEEKIEYKFQGLSLVIHVIGLSFEINSVENNVKILKDILNKENP